jgi:LysR family hydrogen peroxide-inducible transcriptional activator
MNLQQLEYIIAIDKLKNFSKAAETCYVTQATLSAMVKKLEEELGVILFDRKTNPIMTTDCGKDIIAEAKKVLLHAKQLVELSKTVQNKIDGEVRLGIIPTIANVVLPKILKPILTKYPNLSLVVQEVTTQNIIQQLREGTIDVGLVATPLNLNDIEENILYYEALMVYGNINSDKKYICPDTLKNNTIWLLEEAHCFRSQTLHLCHLKTHNLLPHNLRFEANSFETLLNLVDEYGGLTVIPELYYQGLPIVRQQKVNQFALPLPVREVSLVYFRPYAKFRIVNALTTEIKALIQPLLSTNTMKNSDLDIIKI